MAKIGCLNYPNMNAKVFEIERLSMIFLFKMFISCVWYLLLIFHSTTQWSRINILEKKELIAKLIELMKTKAFDQYGATIAVDNVKGNKKQKKWN